MVTEPDYHTEMVQAARSVLLELMHLLRDYREQVVVVGGSVPEFLCPEAEEPYIGTIDVDLALNDRRLNQTQYQMIRQSLLDRGYRLEKAPDSFSREIPARPRRMKVGVDFLLGQDVALLFAAPVQKEIEGELPGGGLAAARIQVASIVPFLVMKAMALDERKKEKDAWDIGYCFRNYPGGVESLVKEFKRYRDYPSVRAGLEIMKKHFSSAQGTGPAQIVRFQEMADAEAAARVRQDAYQRVQYLLQRLSRIDPPDKKKT